MAKANFGEIFLNRYWRHLTGGVLVIILLIGYFYFIKIDIDDWSSLRGQTLIDLQNQLRTAQSDLRRLATVQAAYDALAAEQQTNLSRLSQILPTSADLPQLIVQLEGLAKQTGFILRDVSFASTQAVAGDLDPRLKAVTVNVSLGGPGDYQNLKKLLTSLEQHIRLLDLLSLGITSNQQLSQTADQGYQLQLRTYYWEP